MSAKLHKRIAAVLLSGAVLLTACSRAEEIPETTPVPEETMVIEVEAVPEEHEAVPMPQMLPEEMILPTFYHVTTAADNNVLAPVYLQIGDKSPVVLRIQERLMNYGYMDNDEPTSYYGQATAESVKKFQRQLGLPQDGIIGTVTWDALFSPDTPTYKVANGDDGDDILNIQMRLYQLGYLMADSVTGHFGDKTEEAVRKMQDRNGITVDGAVGMESVNLLYSDEIKANLIGVGEKSELVKKYQQRLIDLGYLRDEADGNFGLGTQKAVMEFQSRNDQVVDGYLGPDTRFAMDSDSAKPFGLRLGDRSDSVAAAQKRLAHYGYLSSSHVTGYFGDLTRNAVLKFQEVNKLDADGTVGKITMAKLESDSAKKKPANVTVSSGGSGSSSSSGGRNSDSGSGGSGSAKQTNLPAVNTGAAGSLINIAQSKLGCPYVWGSKGPNSFDCSGFVYWCLNQAGVSQSYITSSGWRNPGRYTRVSSFDQIDAGDIIVVSGHVGIAAGNGTVIDASSSNGRVVHRSLSNWWRNNFIVAWRIF